MEATFRTLQAFERGGCHIIGEASRNIERYHPDFAAEHLDIPWGIAYEMRNALAHGYFVVDMEIVWKTIQNDLPYMAEQIFCLAKAALGIIIMPANILNLPAYTDNKHRRD